MAVEAKRHFQSRASRGETCSGLNADWHICERGVTQHGVLVTPVIATIGDDGIIVLSGLLVHAEVAVDRVRLVVAVAAAAGVDDGIVAGFVTAAAAAAAAAAAVCEVVSI